MKKQGYNARKDEQLGMTRGKQSGKNHPNPLQNTKPKKENFRMVILAM